MNNNRKKKTQTQTPGEERLKSFLDMIAPVSYTHLRAHETDSYLVCRLLLEKKKKKKKNKRYGRLKKIHNTIKIV